MLLLASGGDDNAIHVHLVELKKTAVVSRSQLQVDLRRSNCYAHAAQITGKNDRY